MTTRSSILVRNNRKEKGFPKPRYQRNIPKNRHKILEYVTEHFPRYINIGNRKDPQLAEALKKAGIKYMLWNKILMNTCMISLDELHSIATMLNCTVHDLI